MFSSVLCQGTERQLILLKKMDLNNWASLPLVRRQRHLREKTIHSRPHWTVGSHCFGRGGGIECPDSVSTCLFFPKWENNRRVLIRVLV